MVGIDWTKADWSAPSLGVPITVESCVLNHSTFIGLNLPRISITDSMAVNVDFREADLSKADFSGSDLSDSLFLNTNLVEADLSRARNYTIAPNVNELRKAKFSLPEAMSLLYNLDIEMTSDDDQ